MDKPDYMSEAEFKDLEEMKDKVEELKIKQVDYMLSMLRYSETDFKHSGYKSLEHAVVSLLKTTEKEVNKIIESYIRKYPDK